MFSNKLRTLLVLMLVLLFTCSFTLFANAEGLDNVSAVSEASTDTNESTIDESNNANSTESDTADSESATVSSESSDDSAAATTNSNKWIGWAIAGVVLLIIALGIFIAIKRNTPFGQKLVKIYKDYKSEARKIVWLSKKELIRQTSIVLVTIIVAIVFLGGLDYVFSKLIQLIG